MVLKKSRYCTFRIPTSEYELMVAKAKQDHSTMTMVVIDALRAFLAPATTAPPLAVNRPVTRQDLLHQSRLQPPFKVT